MLIICQRNLIFDNISNLAQCICICQRKTISWHLVRLKNCGSKYVKMASNYDDLKQDSVYTDVNSCLEQFTTQILAKDFLIEQKNNVMQLSSTYLSGIYKFLKVMFQEKPNNIDKTLDGTFDHIHKHVAKVSTKHNRDQMMKK